MLINNMELIVLIEALKATKAYQESRALSLQKEGKEFSSLIVDGERDKNDLVFFLARELVLSLNIVADMPTKQMYELSIINKQAAASQENFVCTETVFESLSISFCLQGH